MNAPLDPTPEEWARIWLRHSQQQRDEDFRAWERLTYLAFDDPERAWPVVIALLAMAPDDRLDHVGAGPLDRIVDYHGEAFVDRIEQMAGRDERLQDALASVGINTWGRDPEVVRRLVAASGGRMATGHYDPAKLDEDQ